MVSAPLKSLLDTENNSSTCTLNETKRTYICELKEDEWGLLKSCPGVEEAELGKLIKQVLGSWLWLQPSLTPWAHTYKFDLFWFLFCSFYSLFKRCFCFIDARPLFGLVFWLRGRRIQFAASVISPAYCLTLMRQGRGSKGFGLEIPSSELGLISTSV